MWPDPKYKNLGFGNLEIYYLEDLDFRNFMFSRFFNIHLRTQELKTC